MKFFTRQWWFVDCQSTSSSVDIVRVFRDYRQHIAGIADRLPAHAFWLTEGSRLHDAWVRGIELSHGELRIVLTTANEWSFLCDGATAILVYQGVTRFVFEEDDTPETMSIAKSGLTLGYDEFDLTPSGFEHRLLCDSGTEIVVEATDLSVLREDGTAWPSG